MHPTRYRNQDKHRYDVTYVYRIANCLITATYPDQQSVLDNGRYNPEQVAERRCDNPEFNTWGKGSFYLEILQSTARKMLLAPSSSSSQNRLGFTYPPCPKAECRHRNLKIPFLHVLVKIGTTLCEVATPSSTQSLR